MPCEKFQYYLVLVIFAKRDLFAAAFVYSWGHGTVEAPRGWRDGLVG